MRSPSTTCPERGFVLPTAIFLLVVMAALGAFMVQLTSASHAASAQDVQGARALQAARLGIEAGIYAVQRNGNCPGATMTSIPGLNGFTVVWACSSTNFVENGTSKTLWQITSTASYGTVASADYVERQLMATTEK